METSGTQNIQPAERLEDSTLRLKIREYARQQRQDIRTHTTDALRFGLGQIKNEIAELENLNIKDVHGLASRIKRRKHANTEDMYRLSHAFLQGNANINAFAGVPGAMQVVVKELTGGDVQRQIEAAECLCNLSLGDAHVCEKITTLAGSYLVTYLTSREVRLKRSCLWTLANVLATCSKSARTLLQMQLASKLWKLYTAPLTEPAGFHEDAGICLYLLAREATSDISDEDRRYIAQNLHGKLPNDPAAEYYMYIIFQFDVVSREYNLCGAHFQHLIAFFMSNLQFDYGSPTGKLRILYGVVLMSNMFATNTWTPIEGVDIQLAPFVSALNQLFSLKDNDLTMHTLRLVRNLMESQLLDNNQLLQQIVVSAWPYTL